MTKVTEIKSNEFVQEVEKHQGKVLVDFFAPWCGPCKMISPIIDQISTEQENLKIVKVNADNAQELMVKYGIRGIPTLLLFDQGEIVATKVGAASLSQIRDFVN